ncbi:hypothetical protein [Methanosphaera sp. WGK6]|uniref:hypothetical protein n=1 Tax=Methanosphaera sp. WGK6 TaxID=1561964 RepID=UPI00084BE715|nr:hypothetical protein [Methanosphaera sp. WGK6]OED30183.1 hypothetical protein NL43_04635 [Methanosphaera sp. WGK6]
MRNITLICITVVILVIMICGTIVIISNNTSNNTTQDKLTTNNTSSMYTNSSSNSKQQVNNKIVGNTIHNGPKNYTHLGCGGHIIYNGEDGVCSKCRAEFEGDYVVSY